MIASCEEGGQSVIKILRIRRGKMNQERHYVFDKLDRQDRPEALSAFIRQFYAHGMEIPAYVLVNDEPEDREILEALLTNRRERKVKIIVPVRGRRRKLVEMAQRNAKLQLDSISDSDELLQRALVEIQEKLGMEKAPAVIEGYDISNTSGLSSVGSIVMFRDGLPSKADYRKYKIKSVDGPDDYASLAEVVQRRFKRLKESGQPTADLLVIDGGKGQLGVVVDSLEKLGAGSQKVIGIAKGKDRENRETDAIFLPGASTPVNFAPSSPGFMLLQRVRDEAHRFAIDYHRKLRGGKALASSLDSVPGIGPKRKKALLKHFGSVKGVREASLEQVANALGISEKAAGKIHEYL